MMAAIKAKIIDTYKKLKKIKNSSIQDLLSFIEEDPKYMGIYIIHCMKADKAYIGLSTNIPIRWKNHKEDLKAKKHHNKELQKVFNKYGEKSLKFAVLEYCEEKKLVSREKYYINKLDRECCMNAEVTCVPTKEVGIERKINFKELIESMEIEYKERKEYFEVRQLDGTFLIYYPDTGRWKQKGKDKLYFSKSGIQFLTDYVLNDKRKK